MSSFVPNTKSNENPGVPVSSAPRGGGIRLGNLLRTSTQSQSQIVANGHEDLSTEMIKLKVTETVPVVQDTDTGTGTTGIEEDKDLQLLIPDGTQHVQYWLKDLSPPHDITKYLPNQFRVVSFLAQNIYCVVPNEKMRKDLDVISLVDDINAYLHKIRLLEQKPEANGQTGKIKVKPVIGEIVLVARTNTEHYRGLVTGLSDSNPDKISVYLIDIGRNLIVRWKDCYPVTQDQLKEPIFCYPIKLADVAEADSPLIFYPKFSITIQLLLEQNVKLELSDMNQTETYYAAGDIVIVKTEEKLSSIINDLVKWKWEQTYDEIGHSKTDLDIIKHGYMDFDFDGFNFSLTLCNYKIPRDFPVKVKVLQIQSEPELPVPLTKKEQRAGIRKLYLNAYCKPLSSCLPEFDRIKKTYKDQLARYIEKVKPANFFPAVEKMCLISIPGFCGGNWLRAVKLSSIQNLFYLLDKHIYKRIDDPEGVGYRYLNPDFYEIPKFVIETLIEVDVSKPEALEIARSLITKKAILTIKFKKDESGLPDYEQYVSTCVEFEEKMLKLNAGESPE